MPWLLPAARSVCSIHARVSLSQPLPDTAVHQDATCHFPPFLSAEAAWRRLREMRRLCGVTRRARARWLVKLRTR